MVIFGKLAVMKYFITHRRIMMKQETKVLVIGSVIWFIAVLLIQVM